MAIMIMESELEMKDKILELPISEIEISDWDVRRFKENQSELEALTSSIKRDGLLNPLTVLKIAGKYILVAGRRRLKACKSLDMKSVPVYIKSDISNTEKTELRKITLIENIHRRELKDTERSYGILAVYESEGYTQAQALEGTKYIHNQNQRIMSQQTTHDGRSHARLSDTSFKPDGKFKDICQSIGYKPNYQYQLLQLTRDIPEKILEKADKAGLTTGKKIMLTHSKLREHPKIQEQLVNNLATKQSQGVAREKIYQTVSDLETGAIEKVGKNYVKYDAYSQKKSKKEKLPSQSSIKITAASKQLIFELTNIQITKGKIRYDDSVVTNGRDWTVSVIKNVDENELVSLEENLIIVKKLVNNTLDLIDKEFDSRKIKQKMFSK